MGREGRDYWEAQLSEYWDSGLTIQEYSELKELPYESTRRWIRVLEKARQDDVSDPESLELVEIKPLQTNANDNSGIRLLIDGENFPSPIPDVLVDNRFLFSITNAVFVVDLTNVSMVAQNPINMLSVPNSSLLGSNPVFVEFPGNQCRRLNLDESLKDSLDDPALPAQHRILRAQLSHAAPALSCKAAFRGNGSAGFRNRGRLRI